MTPLHAFVFDSRDAEHVMPSLDIDGTLPSEIRGTFLANGPGITRVGDDWLHLLDAHGRVIGVTVSEGRAWLRSRHVATPVLAEELAAKKQTRRRVFTNKPARWSNLFDLSLGNTAMHNVVSFGGTLLAAQDGGHFALDAATLETRGPAPYSSLLPKGGSITPMPRFDPATGRLVVWLSKPGMKDRLRFAELDADLRVARSADMTLSRGGVFLHDVAFTERFFLGMQFASLSIPSAVWGAHPLIDAARFDPSATPWLMVAARDGTTSFTMPLGPRAHFHFVNAFERDGRLFVDAIGYDRLLDFSAAYPEPLLARSRKERRASPPPTIVRYEIDVDARRIVNETVIAGVQGEAPEIDPMRRGRAYRYAYIPARTDRGDEIDDGAYFWFHGLARVDLEQRTHTLWNAGVDSFPSPMAFVPRASAGGARAEDAGWVVSLVQRPGESASQLCVFDAAAIERGPVARVRIPDVFGLISHVHWADGVTLARTSAGDAAASDRETSTTTR